jgi:hypothetical protein
MSGLRKIIRRYCMPPYEARLYNLKKKVSMKIKYKLALGFMIVVVMIRSHIPAIPVQKKFGKYDEFRPAGER